MTDVPCLWLDNITLGTTLGIHLANQTPEDGDIGVSKDASFSLELFSTEAGVAVDLGATEVYVGGVLAYDGGGTGFQTGFDGPGSAVTALGATDKRLTVDPTTDWTSEQAIAVRVVSATVGATYSLDETYTFTTEDYTLPLVLSVTAVTSTVLHVVFSEGMLLDGPTGATSALNSALYAVDYQQADDRQACVWVTVASVAQAADTAVAADTFAVTVDMDLSFWRTYQLTVGAVADEAGNLLAAPAVTTFASWTPPGWPADREFELWQMLSRDDRARDIHGDAKRLLSVWQDTVDIILWEQDRFTALWDLDTAPEANIDALLQDLGSPFRFDLSDLQKRKLAAILVPSYKERGVAGAIVNLALFFLGLGVTVTAWADDQWVLGDSELGIDTDAGPGPTNGYRERYTFTVESGVVLTATERRMLGQIIDDVKPPHTHFVVIDPSDYPVVDHWELGLSEMGETTDLHE